jgi:two-component system, chemotaxis family, sensor kinase CheA
VVGRDGVDGPSGLDGLEELVGEFLVESRESLDQLDRDLVELECDPTSGELLSRAFRSLHNIKGTSGLLGFGALESVTHVGESLLSRLRDGKTPLTAQVTTVLLEMVDAVRAQLDRIERTGDEGPDRYDELVRRLTTVRDDTDSAARPVEIPLLGDLLLQRGVVSREELEAALAEQKRGDPRPLGQILVARGAAEDSVACAVDQQNEIRRTVVENSVRVDVTALDRLVHLADDLALAGRQVRARASVHSDRELERLGRRIDRIVAELHEGVVRTRLQPIETVWSKLLRIVRDLSIALGKSVDVRMEGRETELDRAILEAVRDPLVHLVRNAIDHGIEPAAERVAAGKPERGTLTLRADLEGGRVVLEVCDDGAGIDPDLLRTVAASRGVVSPAAAEAMSDQEALDLVFSAGFSTAAEVTNVSGRGVGMDVVRTNVERVGGSLEVASEPKVGTTVRLHLPVTAVVTAG